MEKRSEHQNLYADGHKNEKWKDALSYISQNDYYPESCDNYCPYHEECTHCKNILATADIRRGNMGRIEGYQEQFCSLEEMQDDTYEAICRAYREEGAKLQVIKAMTGAGKSHSYLKLMEEHPGIRFLIAAPTNLLKDEIFVKADKLGIEVMKTPSLEEIKDEIPEKVWNRIQKFYKRGQHDQVHPYIYEILKKKKIPCLKRLLKLAKTQSCIRLGGFEWDKEDDERPVSFDIPSFCQAECFCMRRAAKEDKLKEDTIAFLKPAEFPAGKYIMVSATADRDICRQFFGEDNVDFYECRKAEYMGTLNQYPQRPMSRSSINSDRDIVRRLMERFAMSGDRVITFMSQNIGDLHFGNTEGSNALEGENILVVGTPYHAEFLYKLVAFAMGMDFDEDEEMELQTVEHNGYRFSFNTYKNENLRAVQFWMLESELEQAVGRARLLRNKCEVHLYSSYPLNQSRMVQDFDYGEI